MEHGTTELYPLELCPSKVPHTYPCKQIGLRTHYETKVNLEADSGAGTHITAQDGAKLSPLTGTLGCWLEVKSKNYPGGVKVALTNYHVIRPAYAAFKVLVDGPGKFRVGIPDQNSDLWEIDNNGKKPKANAPIIESPARSTHNREVASKQPKVQQSDPVLKATAKQELDRLVAFFDNNKQQLGTVYCACGYQRRHNKHRLD